MLGAYKFFQTVSKIYEEEEHLPTAAPASIWHIWLNWSSNKSEFYTSKTYSFSLQQAVKKKLTLLNILVVSGAGMFVDRETNPQPCFQGFLYWWSPENQVEYLSIFVGKGFNGNKCSNCSFVTDPWKKSELFVRKTK